MRNLRPRTFTDNQIDASKLDNDGIRRRGLIIPTRVSASCCQQASKPTGRKTNVRLRVSISKNMKYICSTREKTRFESTFDYMKIIAIVTLALGLTLTGCSAALSEDNTKTLSEDKDSGVISSCQAAPKDDLKNINDGMISPKYRVESGFVAEFSRADTEQIKSVFPSYTTPQIFAANIPGSDGEFVVGLWGIQKYDYGWRITALNKQTRTYSNLGADISENSASGRVNAVMLKLSTNTNVLTCLQK